MFIIEWGNGYAPEAAQKIIDTAFGRFKAHRVQATCWVKNTKSQRVLRKIGMKKEGRMRSYMRVGSLVRDEFLWGITRSDWRKRLL